MCWISSRAGWPRDHAAAIASRPSRVGLGLALGLGCRAQAGGQIEEPLVDSVRTALSSAIANSAPPDPRIPRHARAAGLPALARRHEPAAGEEKSRLAGAQGIPANGLVREQACRPGHRPGARPDPGGKQFPQVRREFGGRARLHAGHAVLDAGDRRRRCRQAVSHADQPALRLRDPAPLHRSRTRRPVHGAGPLQRQPRQAAVPECGVCRRQELGIQRRPPPRAAPAPEHPARRDRQPGSWSRGLLHEAQLALRGSRLGQVIHRRSGCVH